MTGQKTKEHWYCLRTQTKREHIAAAMLSKEVKIEVFCPRISHVRKTRNGKKRFVEALFPGYLFAKFDYENQSRLVIYNQGIKTIVEQGGRRVVPGHVIRELRDSLSSDLIEAPDPSTAVGANVEFISGALKGLSARVLAQMPGGQRVEILLELLGREIQLETNVSDIALATDKP